MAGYGDVRTENREPLREDQKKWVKAEWLVSTRQPLCVTAMFQDHNDKDGNPQLTICVNYVANGQYLEKQFDVTAYDWRMQTAANMETFIHKDEGGRVGFPFHHLRLIRKPPKSGKGRPYLDFEDVDPQPEGCACDGYGVIDPNDQTTWTEHYRLTRQLHGFMIESGQCSMDDLIETGSMSVEDLQRMLKMVGAAA